MPPSLSTRHRVLRLVVHCLLCLLLSLNGLALPTASALSGQATAEQASCHGAGTVDASDLAEADTGEDAAQDEGMPACCASGHCLCACVFSAVLRAALPPSVTLPAADLLQAPAPLLAAARHAVPLRPPIV